MGSLLVSGGGRRRWCLRPAVRVVVGRQLFEQPADVFDRRDARLRVSQGTPPRSRLLPDPCRAAPAACSPACAARRRTRSEEHTSELQSLMRISYAVFCLQKKNKETTRVINKK